MPPLRLEDPNPRLPPVALGLTGGTSLATALTAVGVIGDRGSEAAPVAIADAPAQRNPLPDVAASYAAPGESESDESSSPSAIA